MSKLILFDTQSKIVLTDTNQLLDSDFLEELDIDPVIFTNHDITNVINISSNSSLNFYTKVLPEDLLSQLVLNVSTDCNTVSVRQLLLNTDVQTARLVTKARQLAFWDYNHRFCGRCAGQTKTMEKENAKVCLDCGYVVFPRLTPCVLAAVVHNDKILLGRAPHFPDGVYSLLAGFVEVGESCEETVAREVKEESGVNIKNIRYFNSQSWPFPHSLMLAYIADYDSGDIVVDKEELEDVRWFSFEGLRSCPDLLPAKASLSRMLLDYLIDDFLISK